MSASLRDETKNAVQRHYAALVDDYTDEYSDGFSGYPANVKRLDIILRRAQDLGARTLLDCGCGEGSPMLRIREAGLEVRGFDFVPEMVGKAALILDGDGPAVSVWQGDITEEAAFRPEGLSVPESYDVCMAMGVFPHIQDEVRALQNMASVTRPGGRVLVEFRNELFALFTLNRYSYRMFVDRLLSVSEAKRRHSQHRKELEEFESKLEAFFRLDLPPVRAGTADAPGYDAVLSQLHNPFELHGLFEEAGLRIDQMHFYHYHALPPMFEKDYPELFRTLSLEMERDPNDWRGYFMASAFIVEAVRKAA